MKNQMARPADPHARTALIDAARQEFLKHGILRTRIEDITHACGLSKGAFYLHFATKEALFRELVEQLKQQFERLRVGRELAHRELELPSSDPALVDRLLELGTRHDHELLEMLWTWRDVIDVLLRGCQGTEFDGVMWTLADEQFARVREEFNSLQQLGLVRADVSGEALGLMVVGAYLMVTRQLVISKSKPDITAMVQAVGLVVSQGIAPSPALASASRAAAPARARQRGSKRSIR
jgi:AcrR family transcriptional regulator